MIRTFLLLLLSLPLVAQTVFPIGGPGDDQLRSAHRLSDGTLLVGGGTTDPSWLDAGTTLSGEFPDHPKEGPTAFLLHLSSDATKVLHTVRFPAGFAKDIADIRSTEVPGETTGALHVSGTTADGKGYFIARLDRNFLTAPPAAVTWAHAVNAGKNLVETQPWDVGPDGRVIFARGEAYGYDWLSVEALDASGEPTVVPHWPRHWTEQGEHAGPAHTAPAPATHSGIVVKIQGRGDFRSDNQADFELESPDGNGGVKQGRWPLDAMFPGYFNPETKKTEDVTGTGKGYYGYRWGNTPVGNVSAVCIDRRSGAIFIGGNNKSKLPDGNPDFEPWVVAQTPSGKLAWWQRLYPESKGVSTPDQYVDALAIDYSVPPEKDGVLVVLARCHGNNVNNFWKGHEIAHPDNPGSGFQNQFTGTNGNIHISWLGRMTMTTGTMLHATYMAEFYEGSKFDTGTTHRDPLVTGWPDINAGWPSVNTTRARPALHVDSEGRPHLLAKGKWTQTTTNAHLRMPGPLEKDAAPWWTDFVRAYQPDLNRLAYSSLLGGKEDAEVELHGLIPVPGGVLVTGFIKDAEKPFTTANPPSWSNANRSGQDGVIGLLPF